MVVVDSSILLMYRQFCMANEIETFKDDSTRYFGFLKQIQNRKPRKPLIMDSADGLVTSPNDQTELIADHFEQVFTAPNTQNTMPKHQALATPFTVKEVEAAIK